MKSDELKAACDSSFEFCISHIQPESKEYNELFRPHISQCYRILWFMDGDGEFEVDSVRYTFSAGTLFFLTPGQVISFVEGKTPGGIGMRFCEQFLSDESSMESIFLKYDLFDTNYRQPYIIIGDGERDTLLTLLKAMQDELNRKDAFAHKDYLQHLLHLFLITIQRRGNNENEKRLCINCQADRIFVRFRQQLEHNFRKKHSVQDYASLLNISSKTLTRGVAEAANTTPLKIINSRLALEARRLLQYSDMKVKEIAYHLGFDDPSNFVKFFKRQTGKMPTSYRQ
ncbi:MAG: AraC family transcriptional regulator [Prevotella sp.]|uniref:helix-turn-helix domain-containing protein n=1 Tax=Prevotella sp. TaxID=59823 RepID=UPI002A25C008|nr:AraC family transcriptional regulator [Prevotella sp.]MDD7318075.1 AraC family transcriptional regulator [Prevotellaceae bacterium]MDY4021036.1 AraC family transcriptional regulator [Prevotella sp.]